MANILILSERSSSAKQWQAALGNDHAIFIFRTNQVMQKFARQPQTLLIVDGEILCNDAELEPLKSLGLKILLIGQNWSEERQISILVSGIAGYCENKNAIDSLLRAADSILQGDIWVQRHLVPKIIERLIRLNTIGKPASAGNNSSVPANIQALTHRELDVANMIRQGENNKVIAVALNISERTVKAHLTSIFQKLHVQDRVHLALLLNDIN